VLWAQNGLVVVVALMPLAVELPVEVVALVPLAMELPEVVKALAL